LEAPGGTYVAPVFLTYVTVFVGCVRWPRLPLVQSGDYSYGVYLYGYPILQAVIAAAPYLRNNKLAVAAIGGLLTIAFAAVSRHLIERPTLNLKKHFSQRTIPQSPSAREGA
jgi:peptidoglycan/LPS O-acetylase OafA/YrhL